jgi:hypothetical protein
MTNLHVLPPADNAQQPAQAKGDHLIFKIAAGVVLGLSICGIAVFAYQQIEWAQEHTPEKAAEAWADLNERIAAENDQLILENDRMEASLPAKHAKATRPALPPTAQQLAARAEQQRCANLKASYFATHDAAKVARDAAEHCHSLPGTDHTFFSNAMDGTLNIYDLPNVR